MNLGRIAYEIARYIDHAVLKPAMTPEEVRSAIQLGIDNDVYSVCVQPRDIHMALKMCEGTNTLVSCVLDFPHGCGGAAAKREAARLYAEMGVREIDMVMNYGAAGAATGPRCARRSTPWSKRPTRAACW